MCTSSHYQSSVEHCVGIYMQNALWNNRSWQCQCDSQYSIYSMYREVSTCAWRNSIHCACDDPICMSACDAVSGWVTDMGAGNTIAQPEQPTTHVHTMPVLITAAANRTEPNQPLLLHCRRPCRVVRIVGIVTVYGNQSRSVVVFRIFN